MTQSKITFVGINLVKPTRFFLCGNPVNIYIPLSERTCYNWSNDFNALDNIGVIYKCEQVTLRQLKHIVKCFENVPDRDIHGTFGLGFVSLTFDGHAINRRDINEINRILDAFKNNKPVDRYGDRIEYRRDTELVL